MQAQGSAGKAGGFRGAVNTECSRIAAQGFLPWASTKRIHNNAEGVGEWRGKPVANSFRVKHIIDGR